MLYKRSSKKARSFYVYSFLFYRKLRKKGRVYILRNKLLLSMFIVFVITFSIAKTDGSTKSKVQSIIIEVEGDPEKHKTYIETYYPSINVITTYNLLFKGLALQASPDKLAKISSLEFIKALHPVHTYQTNITLSPNRNNNLKEQPHTVFPSDLNTTSYTGRGIKVGVIDTGIDYNHPDLAGNYVAGYDLVDLDDDPMETPENSREGPPTLHGTHVAGIIAANGSLQGVAPEASIYAYRALGPGGKGSSVQVIAALEQAVKDEVDVINLSLGNSINGPDYPTSMAVNRAVELGVAVVIANGNSGPDNWTVGSPATAEKALSVGALAHPETIPILYERNEDKKIPLTLMLGSIPWEIERAHEIVSSDELDSMIRGKIVLFKRGEVPFYDLAKEAEMAGAAAVIIANNEEGELQGSIEQEDPITIPVTAISKDDGDWLIKQMKKDTLYIETIFKEKGETIAPFSSRGPVTVNWDMKPELLAPGTNILSTIPGGYLALQGTSMAAPHVAGAIALMKEAKPQWTNEQIIGALKTTATPIKNDKQEFIAPNIQGIGKVEINQALQTNTIIDNPLLAFGKIDEVRERKVKHIKVKNNSNNKQTYFFTIPKKQAGMSWHLPTSFSLEKQEEVTIPIELNITPSIMQNGIHQGWLTLNEKENQYYLPYSFINNEADYPKVMGFEFSLEPYTHNMYEYHLYITEEIKNVTVNLYNLDTLMFEAPLLDLDEVEVGVNEGFIKKATLNKQGHYFAIVTVQLEDGTYQSYQTDLYLE